MRCRKKCFTIPQNVLHDLTVIQLQVFNDKNVSRMEKEKNV